MYKPDCILLYSNNTVVTLDDFSVHKTNPANYAQWNLLPIIIQILAVCQVLST